LPVPIGNIAAGCRRTPLLIVVTVRLVGLLVVIAFSLRLVVVVIVALQPLHDEAVVFLHRLVLREVERDTQLRQGTAQVDCTIRAEVPHHGERLLDDQIASHVADEPLKLAGRLSDDVLRPGVVVEDQMQHLVGDEVCRLFLAHLRDEGGIPVEIPGVVHRSRADARCFLLTQGVDV